MKKVTKLFAAVLTVVMGSAAFAAFIPTATAAAITDNKEAQVITATETGISVDLTWNTGYVSSGKNSNESVFDKGNAGTCRYTDVFIVAKAGTEITYRDATSPYYDDAGFVVSSWVKDANGYWVGNPNGANYKGIGSGVNEVVTINADGSADYKYVTSVDNEALRLGIRLNSGESTPKVTFKLTGEKGTFGGDSDVFNAERDFLYKTYTYKRTFDLNYRLYLPKNYDASKEYPMIVFLHGSGERGNDNAKQLKNGILVPFSDPKNPIHDCIVVAPQCPSSLKWVEVPAWTEAQYSTDTIQESLPLAAAYSLLEQLKTEYSVDDDRVYAAGLSMGGYGTWDLLVRHTDMFAAAIPICGGADNKYAEMLVDMPIWTFHGTADAVVPMTGTQTMYDKITQLGGEKITFTKYQGQGHSIWNTAFGEKGLIEWLLDQKLSDRTNPEEDNTTTTPNDVTTAVPQDDITTLSDFQTSTPNSDEVSDHVTQNGGNNSVGIWIGVSAVLAVAVVVLICILFIKKK